MEKLTHKQRHEQLLKIGLLAAENLGYKHVSRAKVARISGVSTTLVNYHFNTAQDWIDELVGAAVHCGNLKVMAQALGTGHPLALSAPRGLRERVLQLIEKRGVNV